MAQHGYLREYDEGFERDEDRGRDWDQRDWSDRRRERGLMFGDRERGRASSDALYRDWRDKQMAALDRDYEDYCREREMQFHRDFDAWRNQRHANPAPLQPGMTQTGTTTDPTGTLELTTEAQSPAEGGQDPMATATLGTTSSGRGRK